MKCKHCGEKFSASDLGAPQPPEPPNTEVRIGFFSGEKETERSKIKSAVHRGASNMWDKWMRGFK